MKGGTGYTFDAFWIECPQVKTSYRRNEHGLQAAETISTIASLHSGFKYPVQSLYESWILMLLNMDRNTLWGSAGGMVFESKNSWDVHDRMEYVETSNKKVHAAALSSISPEGEAAALFNPLNWERNDPVVVELPDGKGLEGAICQTTPDGKTLCSLRLPSVGVAGVRLRNQEPGDLEEDRTPRKHRNTPLHGADRLENRGLGELEAQALRAGNPGRPCQCHRGRKAQAAKGRLRRLYELAAGPHPAGFLERFQAHGNRQQRATGHDCGGGERVLRRRPSRRVMRFYKDFPRIDFETEVQDIPNITVVVSEFPLAEDIEEVRRGIPCGFSHGAWAKPNPNLVGWTKGIVPAVRWSHYSLAGGGGVAILDRGLTGRELNERTPIIYLLNATDKYYGYPNAWLSGKGRHHLEYALVVHEGQWDQARIPQMAWEYNCPPVLVAGRKAMAAKSFVTHVKQRHRRGGASGG